MWRHLPAIRFCTITLKDHITVKLLAKGVILCPTVYVSGHTNSYSKTVFQSVKVSRWNCQAYNTPWLRWQLSVKQAGSGREGTHTIIHLSNSCYQVWIMFICSKTVLPPAGFKASCSYWLLSHIQVAVHSWYRLPYNKFLYGVLNS